MPRTKRLGPVKTDEVTRNRISLDNYLLSCGASTSRSQDLPLNDLISVNDISDDSTSDIGETEHRSACDPFVNNLADVIVDGPEVEVLSDLPNSVEQQQNAKRRPPTFGNLKSKRKKNSEVSDPHLQDYLDHCSFYLTIQNLSCQTNSAKVPEHILGSIKVKSSSPAGSVKLLATPLLYLYVSTLPEKCILYLDEVSYWQVEISVPFKALKIIKNKRMFKFFLLEMSDSCSPEHTISVHIDKDGFHSPKFPSNMDRNPDMLSALKYFLDVSIPDCPESHKKSTWSYSRTKPTWAHKTVEELYDSLSTLHSPSEKETAEDSLPLENLLPELRPYQEDAVRWMLSRENAKAEDISNSMHILYTEVSLPSGQLIYLNKYSGIICTEKQLRVATPHGGILADEMGLGKTVEVLACILSHPRPVSSSSDVKDLAVFNSDRNFAEETTDTQINGDVEKGVTNAEDEGRNDIGDKYDGGTSEYEPDASIKLVKVQCKEQKSGKKKIKKIDCDDSSDYEPNDVRNGKVSKHKNTSKWSKRNKALIGDKDNNGMSDCESDVTKLLQSGRRTSSKRILAMRKKHNESMEVSNNDSVGESVINDSATEEVSVKSKRPSRYKKRQSKKKKMMMDGDHFECLCGHDHSDWDWVQCTHCGSWQHSSCMGFGDDMDESKYMCPHCWVSEETPLVQSRATLVVTPASIHSQWQEEVERHLKKNSLKWTFYPGLKHHHKTSRLFLQPLELADHDLVLVTYEVFRKEVHYIDLPHSNSESGRRFRNPKRFMALPTPLLAIEWWRICLDEAQMVEGVTTNTAEMALRLNAINRWCVTGTPIQKSINDLYGLLLFLGEDPYWQKQWWTTLLYEPYRAGLAQPLLNCLKNCFWRNSKKDVLDQIGLPPQTEITSRLIFSSVEEHFYNRQYQECKTEALRTLNKFQNLDVMLKELDKQTIAKVMWPLGRLRQACCHPQAVRGHHYPLQKSSSTITMEELLTSLIKKTKLECEDFHRQYICALNGLAGIHIICKEYMEAVEKYREVLRAVKEHKDSLKTDKIQQFHTLHNLNQLLRGQTCSSDLVTLSDHGSNTEGEERKESVPPLNVPAGVGRTLEDDNLLEESEMLCKNYLEKCHEKVTVAQIQLQKASLSLDDTKSQFEEEGENWWIVGGNAVIKAQLDDALVQKVKEMLSTKLKSKDSISNNFRTLDGLIFILRKLQDDLKKSHKTLVKAVKQLSSTPSQEDVNSAISCHLRPLTTPTQRCIYCKCHELFNQYEGQLFCFESGFQKDPLTNEEALWGQTRKGTWADSELEAVLKTFLAFLRSNKVASNSRGLIDDGNVHIKMFEALKKEFKCLRAVWMQIRDHASALDELEMAKIRLRLRRPDEPKPDIPLPYILEPEEVQPNKLKLMSERAIAQAELRKKMGQLIYLKNLEKADFGKKGGSNPELCPICQKMFGTQWSVLPCGHCFCVECIRILVTQYSMGFSKHSVRCAVCRQVILHSEISYINTRPEPNQLIEDCKIKGSHSTKVEAVIRCLLKIQKDDPEAKSLVFSSWQLVLNVVEEALNQNEISCVTLYSYNLKDSLWRFKHDPEVRALLLPVHSGANGLNLIEATHVLMVEPLLNPGAEVQALGRVHRIGQTRPTTVHRFIVSSTIEEKIHEACTDHSSDDMTLRDLKALFETT